MRAQVQAMANGCNTLRGAYRRYHRYGREEQGFVDQYGKFYDRRQAWRVKFPGTPVKPLFSEDLY